MVKEGRGKREVVSKSTFNKSYFPSLILIEYCGITRVLGEGVGGEIPPALLVLGEGGGVKSHRPPSSLQLGIFNLLCLFAIWISVSLK